MQGASRWHLFGAVGCLLLLVDLVIGQDDGPSSAEAPADIARSQEAIARGLAFLREDAVKWRSEKKCATCHHGLFTVWAMAEARRRGLEIDPAYFDDVVKWTKERLERIDQPRDTRPGWSMVNTPAIYLALTARFVPGQDVISAEELGKIRGHLLRHQEAGGEWAWSSAPAKNRPPPFFESDEVATRLALLAMPDPDETTLSDELRDSRKKAMDWLRKTEATDTTQAALLRLLWKSRSESAANIQPDIEAILTRQQTDGGFGQLPERPSDAYATGQALYVLSLVGIPNERQEIRRAVTFLAATQREDGSWPMTRRGHTGVTPSDYIVPITYFGSAWATLGLLRTVPK